MAEEPGKEIADLTVAELRARASELEITGRSSMSKDELRQAVSDAEVQISGSTPGGVKDWQGDEDGGDEDGAADGGSADGGAEATDMAAPSIGPHTHLEKFQDSPEERLAKHEQSEVDAMGLDKRRGVTGQRYGASFAKQATVYGVFLVVVVALVIGGKLAADELDQGPTANPANADPAIGDLNGDGIEDAPWSLPDAEQRPPEDIDFPRNPSP